MAIQFTGLGSGLPISDWIDKLVEVKQASITPLKTKLEQLNYSKSAVSTIKSSFESFKSSLQAFTDIVSGTSTDPFAKSSATSSLKDVLTATTTNKTPVGSYEVSVVQLASSTITKSSGNVGKSADGATKFVDIKGAKAGTLSFTVNGDTKTLEIGDDDTLQDIADKINGLFSGSEAIHATIDNNGNFSFSTDNANSLQIGMSDDTSSFRTTMSFVYDPADVSNSAWVNSRILSTVKVEAALISQDTGFRQSIGQGTFKINGEEFEIGETTTIGDLVSKINNNKNVGVTASFDTATNKFTLTSKTTGAVGINMQDDGTNFFAAMGLSNTSASTTLGNDAIIDINGSTITSKTNTVSDTGYDGLTLNLLKMPTDNQKVTITVAQDTSAVKSSIKSFVESYNTIMTQVQQATAKNGYLEMDNSLRNIYNDLRSISSSFSEGTGFFSGLSQIGITTGKVGMGMDEETVLLKIDDTVLDDALKNNLQDIKSLFTTKNSEGTDIGIAGRLLRKTEDSLSAVYGYFSAREDSLTKQVKLQDEKITKAYADVETYKAMLTKQFSTMDTMISKMNNQYQSFLDSISA